MVRSGLFLVFVTCCSAGLLGKYYEAIDEETGGCLTTLADGSPAPYDWRIDDTLMFSHDDWKFGPRGQREKFCVEWTGSIGGSVGSLWAEADDGVRIWVNDALIVDLWNSHDSRGCQKYVDDSSPGCATGGGSIRIVYFQDYGGSKFQLYNGGNGKTAKSNAAKGKRPTYSLSYSAGNPTEDYATEITNVNEIDCCYDSDPAGCTGKKCRDEYFVPRQIARIGDVTEVWRSSFWNGRGADGSAFYYIKECTDYLYVGLNGPANTGSINNNHTMNGDQVVLAVEMGDNVDYFKPAPGKNLCDLLMSNKNHLWSATGEPGTFIQPSYSTSSTHLGGSKDRWPQYYHPGDRRIYLSFWGGNNANGACCHNAAWGKWTDTSEDPPVVKDEAAAWNRMAHLRVFAQPWQAIDTAALGYTNTLKKGTWTPFSHVAGNWGLSSKYWLKKQSGVYDQAEALKGGYYFMRQCRDEWADLEQNVKMCYCTGSDGSMVPAECDKAGTADAAADVQCDVFRPVKDSTVCDMLVARDEHEWWVNFANGTSGWVTPQPYSTHYGGSKKDWPRTFCAELSDPADDTSPVTCTDTRQFLPFWAGATGGYGRVDQPVDGVDGSGREAWNRDYRIWLTKA